MIVISKTSIPKIKDGFYTALLGDLKISGNKVYIPFYKRADSYLEYTNIKEDILSSLKRIYQGSTDILTYTLKENEIISISFPDKSNKNASNKKLPKTKKASQQKKEKLTKILSERNDPIVLGPIIFTDNVEKRKRIHSLNFRSTDVIFQDGYVLLFFRGKSHKYVFPESKEIYQSMNSKNYNSDLEIKLRGGEIFNRKNLLDYIEGLSSGSLIYQKPVITKSKVNVSRDQEKLNVEPEKNNLKVTNSQNEKSPTRSLKEGNKVETIDPPILQPKPVEKQIDIISSIEDNDWNKIKFQKGMVQISYSSKLYGFTCLKSKQEYNYIKSFYQTHHYQYSVTLRNNTPVGVSIPDKIFDFLELGNIIHQMKKSRNLGDLLKLRKLTDGLANRAVEVLQFFNKDKTYYFTKLSEKHSEDFKIRVVWEPNIWSGSSYDIHLTFLFTYLKSDIHYLIWESTEVSTATYIFKFASLEKYNLGVEHFVSCISDINCYKGRMVLRRGNKYLENVKFISHSSYLSKGSDYEWNIKLKKAVVN